MSQPLGHVCAPLGKYRQVKRPAKPSQKRARTRPQSPPAQSDGKNRYRGARTALSAMVKTQLLPNPLFHLIQGIHTSKKEKTNPQPDSRTTSLERGLALGPARTRPRHTAKRKWSGTRKRGADPPPPRHSPMAPKKRSSARRINPVFRKDLSSVFLRSSNPRPVRT